jgi:hypothetical protein
LGSLSSRGIRHITHPVDLGLGYVRTLPAASRISRRARAGLLLLPTGLLLVLAGFLVLGIFMPPGYLGPFGLFVFSGHSGVTGEL